MLRKDRTPLKETMSAYSGVRRKKSDMEQTKTEAESEIGRSERHAEALSRFVDLWGEMASKWGISRTMAQVHALLYSSEEPMDTDEIMAILGISRGNANMNLRSLTKWHLVQKVSVVGSRRDYFTAEKDVWIITQQIIRHRERKELAPVKQELLNCRSVLVDGGSLTDSEQQFSTRIGNLISLVILFEEIIATAIPYMKEKNIPLLQTLMSTLPKELPFDADAS